MQKRKKKKVNLQKRQKKKVKLQKKCLFSVRLLDAKGPGAHLGGPLILSLTP